MGGSHFSLLLRWMLKQKPNFTLAEYSSTRGMLIQIIGCAPTIRETQGSRNFNRIHLSPNLSAFEYISVMPAVEGHRILIKSSRSCQRSRSEISIAWPLGRMNGYLAEKEGDFLDLCHVTSRGKRHHYCLIFRNEK